MLLFFVLMVHVPAHYCAAGIAYREKHRERQRLRLRAQMEGKSAPRRHNRTAPISKWEAFANTYPRWELYFLYICFQGMVQSASAAMTDPRATSGKIALAALVLVGLAMFAIGWITYFLWKKVLRERRAIFVQDQKHGVWQWVDAEPEYLDPLHHHRRGFYSGFVARYGALFEDIKNTKAALFFTPVMFTHRLLVGLSIGAGAAQRGHDVGDRQRQALCLFAVSFAYFGYIMYVKPFHVPCANYMEAIVAACSLVILVLLFFIAEESQDGESTSAGTWKAEALFWVMISSVAAMVLRVVALCLPMLLQSGVLAKIVCLHLPRIERHAKHLERREMAMLKRETRARAQRKMHRAVRKLTQTRESAHAKFRHAVVKLSAARAFGAGVEAQARLRHRQAVLERGTEKLHHAVGKIHAARALMLEDTAWRLRKRIRRHPGDAAMRLRLVALLDAEATGTSDDDAHADERIALLEEALRIDPAAVGAETHAHLGHLLSRRGRLEEAADAHAEAARLDPGDFERQREAGSALAVAGDLVGAGAALRRAVALGAGGRRAEEAEALSALGGVLAQTGDFDGALAQTAGALQRDPRNAGACSVMGVALAEKGRLGEALSQTRRAVKMDPTSADALTAHGRVLHLGEDYAAAEAAHRKALTLDPCNPTAATNLGAAIVARLHDLAEQQKKASEWGRTTFAFLDKDAHAVAIQYHRRALELAPRSYRAHSNLGRALTLQRDYDAAVEHHKRAIACNPHRGELPYELGRTYRRMHGHAEDAVDAFKAAVDLDAAMNGTDNDAPWCKTFAKALARARVANEKKKQRAATKEERERKRKKRRERARERRTKLKNRESARVPDSPRRRRRPAPSVLRNQGSIARMKHLLNARTNALPNIEGRRVSLGSLGSHVSAVYSQRRRSIADVAAQRRRSISDQLAAGPGSMRSITKGAGSRRRLSAAGRVLGLPRVSSTHSVASLLQLQAAMNAPVRRLSVPMAQDPAVAAHLQRQRSSTIQRHAARRAVAAPASSNNRRRSATLEDPLDVERPARSTLTTVHSGTVAAPERVPNVRGSLERYRSGTRVRRGTQQLSRRVEKP